MNNPKPETEATSPPVRLQRVVAINSWAGKRTYAVEVVGETKTRYRVKALQYMLLPGRRCVSEGQVVLVPKSAVGEGEPTECGAYTGGIYGYAPNDEMTSTPTNTTNP